MQAKDAAENSNSIMRNVNIDLKLNADDNSVHDVCVCVFQY